MQSLRFSIHSPLRVGTGGRARGLKVSNYKCSVLVVDDEPYILSTLAALLSRDYEVITAESSQAAQAVFAGRDIDILLTDQKMPQMSGVRLLEWVREHRPRTVRLLMTGFAELEEAVDAINRGQIFRYIFKPWRVEELTEILSSAARSFILERSHEHLLLQLQQLNLELEGRVAQRTKELAEANQQLERKGRELQETNHELEQKNKMLEKLALTDPLTGLPNRRAMDRLAERELRRRERYPHSLALALIDVDHFKEINARYLLPGGDAVLTELGKVLSASVRSVDFVGRIGGEEFLVIAPETNMEGAKGLGERIRSAVANHAFTYNNEAISVHVSIGVAVVEGEVTTDYEHMKHAAAAALSEAKMTGRNRCVFYSMKTSPFEQAG